jgi:hypothetical protein
VSMMKIRRFAPCCAAVAWAAVACSPVPAGGERFATGSESTTAVMSATAMSSDSPTSAGSALRAVETSTASSAPVAEDQGPCAQYAKHDRAALVAECSARMFGYLCNNAYACAKERFPSETTEIRALMLLSTRADANELNGGEGEVTEGCNPETGDGNAYSCLYLAEVEGASARGMAAHKLACKGNPPEGQVPVYGGRRACENGLPIRIQPLPKKEADDVHQCVGCGYRSGTSSIYDPVHTPSAAACARLRGRLPKPQADFVQRYLEPNCPQGS